MRTPLAALLLLAFAATAPAQPKKWPPGPFAEARQRLQKGNFEEARAAFEEVAKKDAKLAPDAAIGIAAAHRAIGDADKALNTLTDALKSAADNPNLLAARSD